MKTRGVQTRFPSHPMSREHLSQAAPCALRVLSPQSPPDILGTVMELSPAGSRAESKVLFIAVVLCLHWEGPFCVMLGAVPRLRGTRRKGGTLLSAGNLRFVSLGPRVWQLLGTHGSAWTCSRCVSPLEQRWPARGMTARPCL